MGMWLGCYKWVWVSHAREIVNIVDTISHGWLNENLFTHSFNHFDSNRNPGDKIHTAQLSLWEAHPQTYRD